MRAEHTHPRRMSDKESESEAMPICSLQHGNIWGCGEKEGKLRLIIINVKFIKYFCGALNLRMSERATGRPSDRKEDPCALWQNEDILSGRVTKIKRPR